MKFEYNEGLLYLPITVVYNTKIELRGIVDTGSAGTVLDIDLFEIDIFRSGSKLVNIVGVGGHQEVLVQTVSQLSIDSFILNNYEVEFCDLKSDFGFDAIIGSELLEKLGAVIHYPKREIEFTTPSN